jgi:hypothetical protein
MKRVVTIGFVLLLMVGSAAGLAAQEERGVSVGVHILGGGRYDNVRMCVGSPAGVPGGPIGELYFDIRVPVSTRGTVVVNIPLFRPIVFAAAFNMLQLEPLVMYEHILGEGTGTRPVVGGGLGIVFHYGPDYHSDQENPGAPFFSIGPLLNGFAGLTLGESNFTAGIKGFFSPLFTPDRPAGVIAGGGLEVHYKFEYGD